MYYVLLIIVSLATLLPLQTQAQKEAQEVPPLFMFGQYKDHQTNRVANISQCRISKDPASGRITILTNYQTYETVIYLANPEPIKPTSSGGISVSDKSGANLQFLDYDPVNQKVEYLEKTRDGRILTSIVCNFSTYKN